MTFQTGPDSKADASAIRPMYEAAKKSIKESLEKEETPQAALMNATEVLGRHPSGKPVDRFLIADAARGKIGVGQKNHTPEHMAKALVSEFMDVTPTVVAKEIERPQDFVKSVPAWSGVVGPLLSEPSKKKNVGIMIGQDMNRKHKKGPLRIALIIVRTATVENRKEAWPGSPTPPVPSQRA